MSDLGTGIRPQDRGARRAPASDVFVARQPIFSRQNNVYGYELLFRSGLDKALSADNPDRAAAKIINDSTLVLTIAAITGGKVAFVNVTRGILVNDYITTFLPKGLTAVEIPAAIELDSETLPACAKLKDCGYLLVLNDFVYREQSAALMGLADIVKVDFLSTPPQERRQVLSRFQGTDVRFLAANLETHEAYKEAVDLGYSYFQGYFCSKPVIVSARDVPGYKLNYLRMLKEIEAPDIDFPRVESAIKHDMALAFKLLRYINSAYFGVTNKVSSILHAMLLLGPQEFKRWASLVVLASMGNDKPDELVVQALIRARFCELLAPSFGMKDRAQELFLLGMFSLLDAVLGRPLEKTLQDLPLDAEIKGALLGAPNRPHAVLDYVVTYERGDWDKLLKITRAAGLDDSGIHMLYQDAVQWAERNFEEIRDAGQEKPPSEGSPG